MREVRNQIVHDGGEATTFKFMSEVDWKDGVMASLDTRFADKYPAYVSGNGIGAEVRVTEAQLQNMMDAAINLVAWIAQQLRLLELSTIRKPK
jgi:hypothetical protein